MLCRLAKEVHTFLTTRRAHCNLCRHAGAPVPDGEGWWAALAPQIPLFLASAGRRRNHRIEAPAPGPHVFPSDLQPGEFEDDRWGLPDIASRTIKTVNAHGAPLLLLQLAGMRNG